MRIGIDASRANRAKKTGVEWYAWHIIQGLKEHLPASVEVVLYTDEPLSGPLAELPEQWSEKVLGWPPKRLWTQVRMSIEMLMNPPDVLFIPAHVFPFIHPKKTVMMIHDIASVRFPEAYSFFERWYSLCMSRRALKKLWKIITPSTFTKQELAALLPQSQSRISVIHHGFDEAYEQKISWQRREKIMKKYNITKPFLLSVGRLEAKKNTRTILHAFTQVKKEYDLQLVLVGKPGYGYTQVQKTLARHKHRGDIIQPGWVAQDDMPILMAGASVFVFPSFYEGFGIPVLEAMAAGTPVVTSKGTSLEEVAGDAALHVDPQSPKAIANAICTLIENDAQRKRITKKGKERVHSFSWNKCARLTAEVLLDSKM